MTRSVIAPSRRSLVDEHGMLHVLGEESGFPDTRTTACEEFVNQAMFTRLVWDRRRANCAICLGVSAIAR